MRNPNNSTAEVTRGDEKVTVITWPPSYSSGAPRHSYLSEGHSALRTYRGGPDGEGVYISFWPGKNKWFQNCAEQNRKHRDDPFLCHQTITHFHSVVDDDLAYRNYGDIEPETHEIVGLNIEAINKAALNIKDLQPKWTPYYNCSDLTLELLERGGLYKLVDVRRYGWKTIVSFGCFTSVVLLEIINLVWASALDERVKKFPAFVAEVEKKTTGAFSFIIYSEPVLWLLGSLGLKLNNPYYQLSELIISGMLSSLLAGYTTYQYSLYSFEKSKIPKKFIRSLAFKDALKAGIIAFSADAIDFFSFYYFKKFLFPSFRNLFFLYFLKDLAERKKTHNIGNYYLFSVLISNLLLVCFPIVLKYLLDTTTTPKQIQKLAKKAEKLNAVRAINETKVNFSPPFQNKNYLIIMPESSSVPTSQHFEHNAIYLLSENSPNLLTVAWRSHGIIDTKKIPLQLLENFSFSGFPKKGQPSIRINYEEDPSLIRKLVNICKNSNRRYPTFLESVYNNRYKVFSGALTLTSFAFFAYKNSIQVVYQKTAVPELEPYRQTKTFNTAFGKVVLLNN